MLWILVSREARHNAVEISLIQQSPENVSFFLFDKIVQLGPSPNPKVWTKANAKVTVKPPPPTHH